MIDWLLDDSPASRLQANLGRAWRVWTALLRNPLAVVGALIVLLFAGGFRQCLRQTVLKQIAVRNIGQRIKVRKVFNLTGRIYPLCNIILYPHQMGRFTGIIGDH